MSQPLDDPDDPEALQVDEMTRSLATFIAEHGGSPTVTGEVTRAMAEIARLYHNARLRARMTERRERDAQDELMAHRVVAQEARGLLSALADQEAALALQDPGRIAPCAGATAAAQAALAAAVARLPEPQEPVLAPIPESAFLAAIDPFSDLADDNGEGLRP